MTTIMTAIMTATTTTATTRKIAIASGIVVAAAVAWLVVDATRGPGEAAIRVGVLHSLTGTMAMSERAVVDATLTAIAEVNEAGGLLGRPVEAVVADGRSDWPTFAHEAERLLTQEKVSVVFGCWTSASRKTVRPVFERLGGLLFYPVQYEGLELSPNIIYTGAAPNQQIVPALRWCIDKIGKRLFLVASDYVFPRTANEIIKDYAKALGAEVVGEVYLPLGSADVADAVRQIVDAAPDVILNTINGDTNVAFFRALRAAGVTPDRIPTMSFSIAEGELADMGAEQMAGDYASWNYFQSVATPANEHFVARFRKEHGADRVLADPMEAAYFGVHLWARAVREAGTTDVGDVKGVLVDRSYLAPEGMVLVDGRNNHTWKTVRIGRIRADGQFDVVWDSEEPVQPAPFPLTRPRREWKEFLEDLYAGWGGRWAAPAVGERRP